MPHLTVASIENIRVQRQLDMELVELDRLWHLNLKALNKERLGLIKDLCRIRQDQQTAQHFQHTTHGHQLTLLTDSAEERIRRTREAKELNKFAFTRDPVDRMQLRLPLLQTPGEVLEERTAREMYKARVHFQKLTIEQCMLDRRSRRRPFWDNAYISKKRQGGGGGQDMTLQQEGQQQPQQQQQQQQYKHPTDRLVDFPLRIRNLGPAEQVMQESQRIAELQREEESLQRMRGIEALRKSPSLPALNTLRRYDNARPRKVHPSLSNRLSASMDYLPVIKSTAAARGQQQQLSALKTVPVAEPSVSSSVATMPTIEET